MSELRTSIESVLVTIAVLLIGYIWLDSEFAGRVPALARVGLFPLSGFEKSRILQAMDAYEQEFTQTKVRIIFRESKATYTFAELGITLDKERTAARIQDITGRSLSIRKTQIIPSISFHDEIAQKVLQGDFASEMVIPQNPTLRLDAGGTVQILPAKDGEIIDMISFNRDIREAFSIIPMREVHATATRAVSQVSMQDIDILRAFTENLLQTGFRFTAFDEIFDMPGRVFSGMVRFTSDSVPRVQFAEEALSAYITENIASKVNQDPVNARFQVENGRVYQFALPQDGRAVNIEETVRVAQQALALRMSTGAVSVHIVRPQIADSGDSEKLGIKTLLAVGESDFKGSPKNRTRNIEVGTSRYNGILIAPGEEFSFNAFLGPVNKDAGYLPELVIKNHTTTAEYGGGLCQVSSTVFRAAVNSGMKITSRRNHAYAVRYYGVPGFDATIYPPYTDFRFLNNTPGYILIQTKIEGTKLSFEFWGTSDNRIVAVDGPNPYGRKPDGAVKSVLKQTVTKDGQAIVEDTFYSNYKSPNLFPHT